MASSRIKPSLLRQMTIRQVLECLQTLGPLSRADLTRETGISAPTVSKAVVALLDSGLLEEGLAPENAVGRPGKRLQLASDSAQVLGVVLESSECQIVTATLGGQIDESRTRSFKTPGSYDTLLDQLEEHLQAMISETEVITLGVGITVPGLQDGLKCLVSPNMPVMNHQTPAVDLEERLKVTCFSVQEVRGLCVAERLYGEASGLDDFAVLDVTTGLGMGAFSRGEILTGQRGLAGEIGHTTVDPAGRLCGCGNHGCLETLATDVALTHLISERLKRPIHIEEVISGLQDGSLQAPDEVNQVLEYLSIAMAATMNLLNPSHLFVHGQMLDISDDILPRAIRMTQRRALGPSFESCEVKAAVVTKPLAAIAGIVHHLTASFGPRVSN